MFLKYLRERQHFLDEGWAVVHDAMPKEAARRLREIGIAAVRARPKAFPPFPTVSSSAKHYYAAEVEAATKLLAKRNRLVKRYKALRRIQREMRGLQARVKPATGEEIIAMAKLLASQVDRPQVVVDAIDATRKNIWMTSRDVEQEMRRGVVGKVAGQLAEEIGGVDNPVLAADSPVLQERFGAPYGYTIAAPFVPVDTTRSSCASVWVFTHPPPTVHILRRSAARVRQQLRGLLDKGLLQTSHSLETQIGVLTNHFDLDPLLPHKIEDLREGSVLVVDPHLFVGFGPNYDCEENFSLQLIAVDSTSELFLTSPSWVKLWAQQAVVPGLSSKIYFPPLK